MNERFENITLKYHEYKHELISLRQNSHIDAQSMDRLAYDLGLSIFMGDSTKFFNLGWIPADSETTEGKPLFHPFRFIVINKILKLYRRNIAFTTNTPNTIDLFDDEKIKKNIATMPSFDQIKAEANYWNEIVNLPILLEPIYWPKIIERYSISGPLYRNEFDKLRTRHKEAMQSIIRKLNPSSWRKIHQAFCLEADELDDNCSLYLLLRLSKWYNRKNLKGKIAGALWFRHIAEIIRLAFEEAFSEQWEEEYSANGMWPYGSRTVFYGSERPLDDMQFSKPRIALNYGLFTGSSVRWYVEGQTEYYAITRIIPEPQKNGIEIFNLYGNINNEKHNIALKLRDCLDEDIKLRRFSIISFDTDVPENVRAVKRQIEEERIIGFIAAHKPDFEFSNFTVSELITIAADLDETQYKVSGEVIRKSDWKKINNGRVFEDYYKENSARKPRSLKGKEWGEALASYAIKNPYREDNGNERPLWREIRAAFQSKDVNYDLQKKNFKFDPLTFELERVNYHH